ncbi:Protein of unknown function [Gryllus bimaculatus]|nr:Protein of unknown function [Gryllus bimaculatus]
MRITELEQRCPSEGAAAAAATAAAAPEAKVIAESESESESESSGEDEASTAEGAKGGSAEVQKEEAAVAAAEEVEERTELPQAPFAPAPVPPPSSPRASARPRQTRAQLDEELAEQKRSLMRALASTLNIVQDTRKEVVMVACSTMKVDPATLLNDPEPKTEENESKDAEMKPSGNEEKSSQPNPALFANPGPRKPRSLEEVKAWLQSSGHKGLSKLSPSGGATNLEDRKKIPQKLGRSTLSCQNLSDRTGQNEIRDYQKGAREQPTNTSCSKFTELGLEYDKRTKRNNQAGREDDAADDPDKKTLKFRHTKTHCHSVEPPVAPLHGSIGEEFSRIFGKKPKNDSESGMDTFFQEAMETFVTETLANSTCEEKKHRKARSKTRHILKEEKKERVSRWASVDTAEISAHKNRNRKERSPEKNNEKVPKSQLLLHKYAAGENVREILMKANRDAEIIKKCGAKWANERSPYEEKMLPPAPARRRRNSSSTSRLINRYWQ